MQVRPREYWAPADRVPPDRAVLRMWKGLPKYKSSLLAQVRTEKIGLNAFLQGRKVPGFDSPLCPCGRGRETARHIAIFCPLYETARLRTLGSWDFYKWVSTPKDAVVLVDWLLATGRFKELSPYNKQVTYLVLHLKL